MSNFNAATFEYITQVFIIATLINISQKLFSI